jgi:hypothetical protein
MRLCYAGTVQGSRQAVVGAKGVASGASLEEKGQVNGWQAQLVAQLAVVSPRLYA